jgi:flagellar motility protein MotE (MotC chaperone)
MKMTRRLTTDISAAALLAVFALTAVPALAAQPTDPLVGTPVLTDMDDDVRRFCSNIADAARDRRYALQKAELENLQKDIDTRIKLLEERRAEYEGWLKRRNDFLVRAEENLVDIYSRMRPDAAAERLAEMNVELAAAILMKLQARKSSIILNEMDSKVAASVSSIMAFAARKQDPS